MQHEGWSIVIEDCLNALRAMPAGSVDLIVTSFPYNIGVNYSQHDDRMPRSAFLAWLDERFPGLHRVLKDNGVVFPGHQRQRYEKRFPVASCNR
jgi:site-specific DNA-methyltransferase (adenine-specific)